jgi:hypothetical protein
MTEHLRYDFPVVSRGESKTGPGATWDETTHEARDDGDEAGEKVGKVTIKNGEEDPPKTFTADFRFDDNDTATYGGKIPKQNGFWKGKEKLKLQKKNGKNFKDEIEVHSWNPKRWG